MDTLKAEQAEADKLLQSDEMARLQKGLEALDVSQAGASHRPRPWPFLNASPFLSLQTLADEMYGADSDEGPDENDGTFCVACNKGFRSEKQ